MLKRQAIRIGTPSWTSSAVALPWTHRIFELIQRRRNDRSAELADELGMEPSRLKANVRKLKALGLTESLEVGYRL